MSPAVGTTTVAIVGGGYTGAAVAYHLARQLPGDRVRIVVIEPRETLGAGLAYSTPDPAHRTNVPAALMTLDTEAPSHFLDWLAATGALGDDPDMRASADRLFPRRLVFSRYVADHLAPLLESGAIVHRRARAVAIERVGGGFSIRLADDGTLSADIVVLATTHPAPSVPAALRSVSGAPGFSADVYADGALDAIGTNDSVLVVGNGLTAADAIASLDARGHRGPVTALSRRGLRSRAHAAQPVEARGDFSTRPATSALSLLLRVRSELAAARQAGTSWHAVFDALRLQGAAVWAALDAIQRRRLVRHLRVFWDVHRFRIGPQVQDVLERRIAEGTLTITAGTLMSATQTPAGVEVSFKARNAARPVVQLFDRIILATGPEHAAVTRQNQAIASLADQGLVRLDPTQLGLHTDTSGLAIGADGETVHGLYIAGPLARGTVGELMGLPQVTLHAEFIARMVAHALEALPGSARS